MAVLNISNAPLASVVPITVRLMREEQSFSAQRAVKPTGHNLPWQVVRVVTGTTDASCKLSIIAVSVNKVTRAYFTDVRASIIGTDVKPAYDVENQSCCTLSQESNSCHDKN